MQKIKNNIIWLDEVDSTNSFVLKNIKKLENQTAKKEQKNFIYILI